MKKMLCPFLCLLAVVFCSPPAWAHELQVEPVVVIIKPQKGFLTVEIKGNGEDVVQATEVLPHERLSNVEFAPAVQERLQEYINRQFTLRQGGRILSGEIRAFEYWTPDELDYTVSRFSLILNYPRDPSIADKPFDISNQLFDYLPNARTIVSVSGIQKSMVAGDKITLDPSAVSANLLRNIWDFGVLGAEHIVLGPDHILFILALLLVAQSFPSLVKTLSGFTLAHSITLILSALSVVVLPDKLVEIVIAISIIYVGLENIFLPNIKDRFWPASIFGLIHGFGFSGVLREIGLPDEGLVWSLLSFNLGVEIGQVLLCAVAFPLLLQLKKKVDHNYNYGGMPWTRAVRIMSWIVVALGSFWLVERVFS